jgi:hypothetical protein
MTTKTKPGLTDSGTEEPPMELNIPEVVAEVRAAFLRYQHAVDTKDVETMNELFWTSPFTVRFGPNGTLIGHDAIANYRQTRTASAEPRALQNTVITTFGRNFAATNTETTKAVKPGTGRQSQVWIRTSRGWRIAAAHVSDQPDPK